MSARKYVALVSVLVLLLTALIPVGAMAQETPDAGTRKDARWWIEPVDYDQIFYVGGPTNNVTEVPSGRNEWLKQAPADLENFYVWSHSSIIPRIRSNVGEYWHTQIFMSNEWIPDPPRNLVYDSRLTDITFYEDHGKKILVDRPKYLYFAFYIDTDSWPDLCYAAVLQPVAAAVEEIRIVSPEEPAGGYSLTDSVVVEPVWTVGITDGSKGGGSFTPVPDLHGWPNLAAVRWGIKGETDPGQVVTAADNVVPCVYEDTATLVPPYTGGDVTYTATLETTTNTSQTEYYIHATDPPAEITVHWNPDSTPRPTPEPTATPKPQPTDEPIPDNALPESVTDVNYYVGGEQNNVNELPVTVDAWPKEAPELETQYAWVMDSVRTHVTTSFDYGYFEIARSQGKWCETVPDPSIPGLGLQFFTGTHDKYGITVNDVQYIYFLYYDKEGGELIACYGAKLQPVAASLTGLRMLFPDEEPDGGIPLSDTVMLKPVWTVGTTVSTANFSDFTPMEGLSGCPAGAAVQWSVSPSMTEVVDAPGNRTNGMSAATLVAPEGGGSYSYSARAVSTGGSHATVNKFNIVPTGTPPSIEVNWESDHSASLPPLESVPGSGLDISIVPGPDGSGALLKGLTLSDAANAATAGQLLSAVRVPDGYSLEVRRGNTVLASDDVVGTGCTVIVLNSADKAEYRATVVIRGDVLGTGVLGLSQLTRLTKAYTNAEPLEGPYLEAGRLLADSQSVSLTDVVVLAGMIVGSR